MKRITSVLLAVLPLFLAVAALAGHLLWFGPILVSHGSSSAFDTAVTLGVVLICCVLVLLLILPTQVRAAMRGDR